MELKKWQTEIDTWLQRFEKPYFSPLSMMACLTEEVGEVARVMNCLYGDKNKKREEQEKNLVEELGDLLFSVICIANDNKIDLDEALKLKFEKINKRDINRWKHKK